MATIPEPALSQMTSPELIAGPELYWRRRRRRSANLDVGN